MKSTLLSRFQTVTDWLKFAEAKHFGLIALNGAAIFGLLTGYPKDTKAGILFLGVMIFFLAVSIFLSVYSFVPVLSKSLASSVYNSKEFEKEKDGLNSLYFNTIAKLTPAQLYQLIVYKEGDFKLERADDDLLHQIIEISKIANTKMNIFIVSSWCTLIAVIVGVINLIIMPFIGK